MSTINDKSFIDRLITGNGRLPEDQEDAPDNPRAVRIVEYKNGAMHRTWGVVWPSDPWDKYLRETEFIHDPRIIWEQQIEDADLLEGID